MNIEISYYSQKGDRETNEDAVSVLESNHTVLALAADGLGGHGDGEKAAKLAVSSISHALQQRDASRRGLIAAIEEANGKIVAGQGEGCDMRTTIAALWLREGSAVAANVGDTRIYQFRQGAIVYQSVDHSLAQMAVRTGEIAPEQLRSHADRSRLVRALGAGAEVRVDSEVLTVLPGDSFLLCTDGFWEPLTEEAMAGCLRTSAGASHWLGNMRRLAEAGGAGEMDNHSAIVLTMR